MGSLISKKGGQGGGEVDGSGGEGKGVVKLRREIKNPYVFRRTSSMYFDEDGDLAHEFYTEKRVRVKSGVIRWIMRRVTSDKLTPQGEVDLPHPRLNVELPVVLVDAVFVFPVRSPD